MANAWCFDNIITIIVTLIGVIKMQNFETKIPKAHLMLFYALDNLFLNFSFSVYYPVLYPSFPRIMRFAK
jgi:hypothetical protein